MKSLPTLDLAPMQSRLSATQLEQIGDAVAVELDRANVGLLSSGLRSFRLLALLLVSGCATDGMLTVTESVSVPAAPAKTWDTIKDFMHWQAWHPAFVSTDLVRGDGSNEGTVRLLTTKDGGKFTEELVAYDDSAHSYSYRILESGAPVSGYVSTLMVSPSEHGSKVVWSSHFKATPGTSDDDAKKLISGVYRAGLDNLAATIK